MGDITGSIEESILYELLVLSEWSQEQDVPVGLVLPKVMFKTTDLVHYFHRLKELKNLIGVGKTSAGI